MRKKKTRSLVVPTLPVRCASSVQHHILERGKELGRTVAAALSRFRLVVVIVVGLVTCGCVASAQAPPDEAHATVTFFGVEVEYKACLTSGAANCFLEFSIYRNPPGFTQNPIWDGLIGNADQASHTFMDQQVKVGQSYTYMVCGGGLADSSQSNCLKTNTVKLSTPPPPTPTPTPAPKNNPSNAEYCPNPWAPPQHLSVIGGVSQVYLKWTNPSQPCPAFFHHIVVYRMNSAAAYQQLAVLDKANNGTVPDRYTDSGLQQHTTYYYQVCESDPDQYKRNCAITLGASTRGADPILTATRTSANTVKLQIAVDQDIGMGSIRVTREGSDDPCRQGGKLGNGLQGCRTVTTGPNGVATSPAQIATVYNWSQASGGPAWTTNSKSAPYIINLPNDTGVAPGVEYYYQAQVVWASGEQDSTIVTVPNFYATAPAQGTLAGGPKPVMKNGAPAPSQSSPLPAQQRSEKSSDPIAEMRSRFGNSMQTQAWTKPKVMNPSAATANTATEAILRRQQQTAENEKSQILAMRKAGGTQQESIPIIKPGTPTSTTMSASTGGSRTGATPATGHPASSPGQATAPGALSAICPPGTVPQLRTVDGERSGVIFTPETNAREMISTRVSYFYTIEGCHFGNVPGQVALVGGFSKGRIDLAIDTWTDGGIVVHVPSDLSGELDQDNITLSLTISGTALQAPGMKFYAAREEILLGSVPSREATLALPHLAPNFPFYQSPGFGTLDVQRNTDQGSFSPLSDYFSFEGLQRGFVPVAFQAQPYAPQTVDQCNYMIGRSGMTISFDGTWNAQWDSNRLRVDWRVSHCNAPADSTHPVYNHWASWYGAKIWVSGPRGVNPWQVSYIDTVTPPHSISR